MSDQETRLDPTAHADRLDNAEERIQQLQKQAARLAGGEMVFWECDGIPLEVRERFWRNIVAFESQDEESRQPLEILRAGGLEVPPGEELGDAALHDKLWELIRAMAAQRWYLFNTDHLSERELYEELVEEVLIEDGMNGLPDAYMIIDLISSGSSQAIHVALKHYWDEDERRHWAESFPEDEIPEHEDLPYDRDRLLPRPPGDFWNPPEREGVM